MEAKRIGYLLLWMLLIGMILVHLQTLQNQQVYQSTLLKSDQQELEQRILDQQVEVTSELGVPGRIRQKIESLGLDVVPVVQESEKGSAAGGLQRH